MATRKRITLKHPVRLPNVWAGLFGYIYNNIRVERHHNDDDDFDDDGDDFEDIFDAAPPPEPREPDTATARVLQFIESPVKSYYDLREIEHRVGRFTVVTRMQSDGNQYTMHWWVYLTADSRPVNAEGDLGDTLRNVDRRMPVGSKVLRMKDGSRLVIPVELYEVAA